MIYLTVVLAVLLAGTLYALYIITATLVLTQRDRDRQRTLYQDAIDALAERHADLDARDAEIEQLRAVRTEYLGRLMVKRQPMRAGWTASWEN